MRALPLCCAVSLLACGPSQSVPDAGSGPACAAPSGPVVTHTGSLSGAETWSADSVHVTAGDFTVAAGAVLTIAPCAEVRLGPNTYFNVTGRVVARGEPTRPIVLKSNGGRFASIFVRQSGALELSYATIAGGGALPNSTLGAAVLIEGGSFPPLRPLFVDHVTISDSAGYGVLLRGWAGFAAGSTDLTVTDCGKVDATYRHPLRISLNSAGTIPTGAYTGNGLDELQVVGETTHFQVELDDALRNRGVPYRIGGNGAFGELRVGAQGSVPTLTIEPGVTVRFETSTANPGRVLVGTASTTGRLVAVGTAAQPVVFEPAVTTITSGSWRGVDYAAPVDVGNRLEFVVIDGAGGPGGAANYGCPPASLSTNDAALRFFGQPSSAFVTSTTLRRSAGHGVLRGWRGSPMDFLAGNTFDRVTGCHQVEPKDPTGACPANPSCPK